MSKKQADSTFYPFDPLTALGPLDGRYSRIGHELSGVFSEYALIKYRIYVEVKWLVFLIDGNCQSLEFPAKAKKQLQEFGTNGIQQARALIDDIYNNFSIEDAQAVKEIERITNHDVKACELFVAQKLEEAGLDTLKSFVHICCTSEDITNLAYALMLLEGKRIIKEKLQPVISRLCELTIQEANTPMLAHTHGQPATPTTFGKEMGVFLSRIGLQLGYFERVEIFGKFNGAAGNYAAAVAAYPDLSWGRISIAFIQSLHPFLQPLHYTTQIEPHDYISRLLNNLKLLMQIIRDLDQDMWSYISRDYLTQKVVATEVGSSTMPHKVNPITFENSEGNIKVLTGLCNALADELPRSRMQRDLSDSSLLRNLGLIFGYAIQALDQTCKGLNKIEVNHEAMTTDIDKHPEVYAEAVQTILRSRGVADAYDRLKNFTRGKAITRKLLLQFIYDQPELTINDAERLKDILYHSNGYIGLSEKIALAVSCKTAHDKLGSLS